MTSSAMARKNRIFRQIKDFRVGDIIEFPDSEDNTIIKINRRSGEFLVGVLINGKESWLHTQLLPHFARGDNDQIRMIKLFSQKHQRIRGGKWDPYFKQI